MNDDGDSHSFAYIEKKDLLRCVILLIPGLGNLVVGLYDLYKYLNTEDSPGALPDTSVESQQNQMPLQTIVFGNRQWAELGGQELIADQDPNEELYDLPDNYDKYFAEQFPGKKMEDTLLVRVLKTHTLDNLGAIAKNCMKTQTENGYGFFLPPDQQEPIPRSYWIIVPKELTPGTRGKKYVEQCRIVTEQGLEVPKLVEVVAAMVAHFSLARKCLFEGLYSRCQETWTSPANGNTDKMAADITPAGLCVDCSGFDADFIGVVGLRKFSRP